MDPIDQLLAELNSEYEPSQSSSTPNCSASKSSGIDHLLAEVKADFDQRNLIEEKERQGELKKQKIEQQKQQAKNLAVLKKQAEEWLKTLDCLSIEGLWFKDFTKGYPSELEAAIDYLQALN